SRWSSALVWAGGGGPGCCVSFILRSARGGGRGLQGFRATRAGRLAARRVRVEAHGDDTDQEASARGHVQPIGADLDQSIAFDVAQARQFGGEILVEIK